MSTCVSTGFKLLRKREFVSAGGSGRRSFACAWRKKTGPSRARSQVRQRGGASESPSRGVELRTCGCQSGRITAPACHAARQLLCKLIPRRTTRHQTCQPCDIGKIVTRHLKNARRDCSATAVASRFTYVNAVQKSATSAARKLSSSIAAHWRQENREMPARGRRS